jgi:PAS domain S-box-containing protein
MSARPAQVTPPTRASRRGDTADHFRIMADYAPVMIWLADPEGKSVYFNRAWLEFTGRELAAELGSGWTQAIHAEDRERCIGAYAAAFAAREPFEIQYRLRRRDGEHRWLLDKGVPLFTDERLAGFVGSCLDITDRVLAEESARAREFARDQFLAIVSHELRSPLNGIKSWTHVLENQLRDADPAIRRALAGIMIGVDHQVRLIDDLLDLTRAVSGNLGLVKQPMLLLPVLADAVESLRALAAEKGLRIVTGYELSDREIHGDPDRIRQIFVNLITNSIKFTRAGGTIWVSAAVEGETACVAVRDNGAGIPPDFLPHVFDPFRQADPGTSSRPHEGLGLGLALVQRLTAMHAGHVTCESDGIDRGAAFRVHLPLLRDRGTRVVLGAGATEPLPSLVGTWVLLIDDQIEARESVAALLLQAGAKVRTAASCNEALERLEAARDETLPQIIVCDIAMPMEDGYATLKRIRAWEDAQAGATAAKRPAIALSAFAQREDRIRALNEGFHMHLTKPVAPAELIVVIASVARALRV